jgi:hypothetical protein
MVARPRQPPRFAAALVVQRSHQVPRSGGFVLDAETAAPRPRADELDGDGRADALGFQHVMEVQADLAAGGDAIWNPRRSGDQDDIHSGVLQ